ncbi:MAG: diaminopimelate decarboxylase [Bacteroidota bacterium]
MELTIATTQLLDLSREYGTPLYVYHTETIQRQYQKMVQAFEKLDVKIFYACKALTNIHVLKYIHSLGCNIDCSSSNEVLLALKAGFTPERILYTSNGICFSEIEAVADTGAFVNIDSLSNLEKFGKKFGSSYPVGVRLRPNIMAGGHMKIATGHDKSKFGIATDQLSLLKDIVDKYEINIHTLHIHTGSDISDAKVFMQGLEFLFEILPQFPTVKVLDLGGGFKVPYHPSEKETDLNSLAQVLEDAIKSHPATKDRPLQLWFEPGKFLVSQCGYLLTKVNVLKEQSDLSIAGIDTGLNHLIRPMMYDAYHHITNLSASGKPERKYMVTGNICETDTFSEACLLPEIQEGDVLAIHNAGAYGFEMSSSYNARFRPAEVLVSAGRPTLIRRRENLDDLLRNQTIS